MEESSHMASSAVDFLKKLIIELGSSTTPAKYVIGNDIEQHVSKVSTYITETKCETDEQQKHILISSLEEKAKFELFALPDYNETNDCAWLCGKLRTLYK